MKSLSEKGQAEILIILLALVLVFLFFLIVGGISAPDRCAITVWEIVQFWKDFCHAPIPGL